MLLRAPSERSPLRPREKDERAGRGGTPDPWRARSVRSGRTLKRVAAEDTEREA
ncbi:hypothetical protein [Streptomyces kronopolitis]|uniref:hypothetical protein n=1 Tax=Streptomyces kronopolitis TaxID=1612435 RepID=UPI003F56718B